MTNPTRLARRERRRLRWTWFFASVGLTLLALALAVAAALFWARSESGSLWLLRSVPGLQVQTPQGALLSGKFSAQSVHWQQGASSLRIEGLTWDALSLRFFPHRKAWFSVELDRMRASSVNWQSGPSLATPREGPLAAPAHLRLPLHVRVYDLQIGSLQVDTQTPVRDIELSVEIGANSGSVHELQRLVLSRDRMRVQLQGSVSADAAMRVDVQASARSTTGAAQAFDASAKLGGSVTRIELDATANTLQPTAAVRARATLTPFAAWPIAALQASTEQLDLATFSSDAPKTQLSGRAVVRSSGLDAPIEVDIALSNSAAGRWDEKRLPISALTALLRGKPDALDTLTVERLDLRLGSASAPAGRVSGSGQWRGQRADLALTVDALDPVALDKGLPSVRIAGPLTLQVTGLPSPDPGASTRTNKPVMNGALNLRLEGQGLVAGTPKLSVAADLRGELRDGRLALDLRDLSARAGEARIEAKGRAQQMPKGWAITGKADWQGIDPGLWAGDHVARAAAGAPHRLNGAADVDLSLTPPAKGATVPAWAGLRGQAKVVVADSLLAGAAVAGEFVLKQDRKSLDGSAKLTLAGNEVTATLTGPSDSAELAWRANIAASDLAPLRPLERLHPSLKDVFPVGGSVRGKAQGDSRGAVWRSEGELHGERLRHGTTAVTSVKLDWRAGGPPALGAPDAALTLRAQVEGLNADGRKLDVFDATVSGTWREHQLTVVANAPLRPPTWADPLIGGATVTGTLARLAAKGSWVPQAGGAGQWRGEIVEASARARDVEAPPWLVSRGMKVQAALAANGSPQSAQISGGRLDVLGAGLRWRDASWQPATVAGQAPRLSIDAELEPFVVAPWLQRVQPSFGWAGDLMLTGKALVKTGTGTAIDVVLERRSGDLLVRDEAGVQRLGLTDLRLALSTHDGVWAFTQAIAGSNIGVMAGAQVLRTPATALWPAPATPLQGTLELRVDKLSTWAPWVPAGWRLGGALRTSASFAGTAGAPAYVGEVVGSELVIRNLLEGVNLRDGELRLRLAGEDARVERFVFKGGDGVLRLTGGAHFGAKPRAQLRLDAERFRVLGHFDRRLDLSGGADLLLQADQLQLNGKFTVDEGLFDFTRADAPSLDEDVTVVRRRAQARTVSADAGPLPAPLRNARVALEIELGEQLKLRGRGLQTRLGGKLTLTAPGGRLAINGVINTRDGTYKAYGQDLQIERGLITFSGPIDRTRLDILALRPKLDVQVGVQVSGNMLAPRVRLFSEPEMAEVDKLSWLLLGRAPDTLGRADSALLQRAALAVLSGEGESTTDGLLRNIGLDEFSVRQSDNGDARDTIVTLGKQLSDRWYVGYEHGVNAATGSWQLIYRIAQRFTLRAQSGVDNAVDMIWTWRWN